MLKVEIDGREVEVPHGATVMDATHKLGIYVPHFCYHKKLSIAANCRMCLVEVEKMPKLQIACNTRVTEGMSYFTDNERVRKAREGICRTVDRLLPRSKSRKKSKSEKSR